MNRYNIYNHHSAEDLGTYEAENENAALDAMARDYGYKDYAEVVETCGRAYDDCRDELVVTLMDYEQIFRDANNGGRGFAVGDPEDGINDLAETLGGELIARAYSDLDVAVYQLPNGDKIIVGDAHGPWAVDCPR